MMNLLKNFFEKRNLRPFESIWLIYVHILAVCGLVYAFTATGLFMKILLTHCIIHNIAALGITAGAHRLWAHRSYQGSFVWRVIAMLLNSGIGLLIFRSEPRINFSLEQRP